MTTDYGFWWKVRQLEKNAWKNSWSRRKSGPGPFSRKKHWRRRNLTVAECCSEDIERCWIVNLLPNWLVQYYYEWLENCRDICERSILILPTNGKLIHLTVAHSEHSNCFKHDLKVVERIMESRMRTSWLIKCNMNSTPDEKQQVVFVIDKCTVRLHAVKGLFLLCIPELRESGW